VQQIKNKIKQLPDNQAAAFIHFINLVKWSGGHSTPAGTREKRGSGAQWNELVLTI